MTVQTPTPPTWPTWPFTRLTPKEMAKLLKDIAAHERDKAGEALL